jgi:thiol-disulfide isomerase/thioredoxin
MIMMFFTVPLYSQADKYFNGFQDQIYKTKNVDSALYYANQLAKSSVPMFQALIHESFIQLFVAKNLDGKNDFQKELLSKMMNDTSKVLVEAVSQINYLVKVQENLKKPAELNNIVREFLNNQIINPQGYSSRTERYALLIYQIVIKNKKCKDIADSLLNYFLGSIYKNIANPVNPDTRAKLEERAYYRYLYAYFSYYLAETYRKKGDYNSAVKYYRIASDFSPDEMDNNSKPGYYYEMHFLSPEKPIESFKENYLAFLLTGEDKSEILRVMTERAIGNPIYLGQLKAFYNRNYHPNEGFTGYWTDALNKFLKPAQQFSLPILDGAVFSLKDFKGKWVLVDFWGTWCNPCKEELPKLQKFYEEVVSKYSKRIEIITIACKDSEFNVRTLMEKNKYSFPVIIADTNIEKAFEVSSYPTKALITPDGKYLKLPYDEDWVKWIKIFCEL